MTPDPEPCPNPGTWPLTPFIFLWCELAFYSPVKLQPRRIAEVWSWSGPTPCSHQGRASCSRLLSAGASPGLKNSEDENCSTSGTILQCLTTLTGCFVVVVFFVIISISFEKGGYLSLMKSRRFCEMMASKEEKFKLVPTGRGMRLSQFVGALVSLFGACCEEEQGLCWARGPGIPWSDAVECCFTYKAALTSQLLEASQSNRSLTARLALYSLYLQQP